MKTWTRLQGISYLQAHPSHEYFLIVLSAAIIQTRKTQETEVDCPKSDPIKMGGRGVKAKTRSRRKRPGNYAIFILSDPDLCPTTGRSWMISTNSERRIFFRSLFAPVTSPVASNHEPTAPDYYTINRSLPQKFRQLMQLQYYDITYQAIRTYEMTYRRWHFRYVQSHRRATEPYH